MEGRINKEGQLEIKRKDGYRLQMCLYDMGGGFCGDWCPQFGEPLKWPHSLANGNTKGLKICQNRELVFSKFKDERTEKKLDNAG